MSRCEVGSEQLIRFMRGQLAEPEITNIERHVESCVDCSETLADLRFNDTDLFSSLASVPEQPADTDRRLVTNLVDQISDWRPRMAWAEPTHWADRSSPGVMSSPELEIALKQILRPAEESKELGRLGPFVLRRILGVGGMGIVCEAEDPGLKRRVAIKILKPELAANKFAHERFVQEAQAAAAIEHPNVVAIHLVGEDGGVPYFAMPMLSGVTLQEYVGTSGALHQPLVLSIARQISAGLAAAHHRGLMHQDIEPANIFVVQKKSDESPTGSTTSTEVARGGPHVMLLDFGLARAVAADAGVSESDSPAGTPSYMSPEQAEGRNLDHRSDLFSLGCVLYWMSTGQSPFGGRNKKASLLAVSSHNPPTPESVNQAVSKRLSAVIMKLMEKNPDQRFQSATAVIDALDSVSTSPGSLLKSPGVRKWVTISALLIGIVALGTVFSMMTAKGLLVLEVNEPDVKVSVDGAHVEIKSPRDHIELTAGEHELEVTKDGFTSYTNRFHIRRGDKVELTARLESLSPTRTPAAKVKESTEFSIEVPANSQWTATGLTLRLDMVLRITASGVVDAAPETESREYYQQVPPAGREERLDHFPEPKLPGLCLVGRIGNGRPFLVGEELSLIVTSVDANGELYLGINDDLVDDNFGAWKVKIRTSQSTSK